MSAPTIRLPSRDPKAKAGPPRRHRPGVLDSYYSEGHFAPVVIITLLHVYTVPAALPKSDATSKALRTLVAHGLAEVTTTGRDGYEHDMKLTARGYCYVQMLLAMPMPQPLEGWANPYTGEPIKVEQL